MDPGAWRPCQVPEDRHGPSEGALYPESHHCAVSEPMELGHDTLCKPDNTSMSPMLADPLQKFRHDNFRTLQVRRHWN